MGCLLLHKISIQTARYIYQYIKWNQHVHTLSIFTERITEKKWLILVNHLPFFQKHKSKWHDISHKNSLSKYIYGNSSFCNLYTLSESLYYEHMGNLVVGERRKWNDMIKHFLESYTVCVMWLPWNTNMNLRLQREKILLLHTRHVNVSTSSILYCVYIQKQ